MVEPMINNAPVCETKLITDTPNAVDKFGAHSKIANAIVELIASEDGGKTIGLEGGWGAGKSTVVNIIKGKLEEETQNVVIVFDAWAHQGDPLRRTFLENLIKQLSPYNQWIDAGNWKKKRDGLTKRLVITNSTTYPQLGIGGLIFAFLLLLSPVASALVDSWLNSNASNITGFKKVALDWRLLGLIPYIAIILLLLYVLNTWRRKKQLDSEIAAIFAEEQVNNSP
jgi:energy-coupling factor transporter ATP-binding protein EcfA2